MALRLCPLEAAPPSWRDRRDYAVMSRDLVVGRIYEDDAAPKELRWYWVINGVHAPMVPSTSGRVATLGLAKAQLTQIWRKWLSWAGLQELEPTLTEPGASDRGSRRSLRRSSPARPPILR